MSSDLLFDSATWLVWLTPFVGVFAAGLTRRREPVIEGDRVLRHDLAARVEHWTHGVGTAALLVSGIALGLRFTPSLLRDSSDAILWMNVHFVAVIAFLFGTFYYAANTVLSSHRFAEHLPTKNALSFTVQHYGRLLGFKYDMPPEAKYYESEKMAYVMALGASVLVILTGLLKVGAHVVDIPGGVMGAATWTHDIATVVMFAFFLAHVFFAAIAPMAWPVLPSMFHGYVTRDHAEEEHAGWYAQLAGEAAPTVLDDDNRMSRSSAAS
ncbi:MAG: cytochrome b/b6 domain-containing protein [Coriobacteriia bacterium]